MDENETHKLKGATMKLTRGRRVYDNGIETVTRINPTCGYSKCKKNYWTPKCNFWFTDSRAFDMWLAEQNFERVGVDK